MMKFDFLFCVQALLSCISSGTQLSSRIPQTALITRLKRCVCSMIYSTCLYTPCTHHLPSSSMKLGTAKVNPTEYEQSVIDALNADTSPKVETKKHKRKKAKGPNPLSVRKSKKCCVSRTPVSAGVVSKSKVS